MTLLGQSKDYFNYMTTYTRQLDKELSAIDSHLNGLTRGRPTKRDPNTHFYDTIILKKSEYVTGEMSSGIYIESLLDIGKATFLMSTAPIETIFSAFPLFQLTRPYNNISWAITNNDFSPTNLPTSDKISIYIKEGWVWCQVYDENLPRGYWDVTVTLWNKISYNEPDPKETTDIFAPADIDAKKSSLANTAIDSVLKDIPKSEREIDSAGNGGRVFLYLENGSSYTNLFSNGNIPLPQTRSGLL